MGKLAITRDQCNVFPGGWSVKPDAMYAALSNMTFSVSPTVLEFGAGAGTHALAELLQRQGVISRYISYEDNPVYVCNRPDVETVRWCDWPRKLVDCVCDLAIIDGPAGSNRSMWYPLLKPHVREGTILMIDDYCHFTEFEQALNTNFKHEVVAYDTQPPSPLGGQVSWLVTRVISPK